MPESRLEEVLLKMNPQGLYGAFDEDADQIRALALIGSMAHLRLNPDILRSRFKDHGLNYESIMAKLRAFAQSTNLFQLNEEFGVQSSL